MRNGELHFLNRISNYNGYSRHIYVDKNDNLWLPVKGIGFIRLTLSNDKTEIISTKEFNIHFEQELDEKNVLGTYINDDLVIYGNRKAYNFELYNRLIGGKHIYNRINKNVW